MIRIFATVIRKEKREKIISSKRFRFEEGENEENDITADQVHVVKQREIM